MVFPKNDLAYCGNRSDQCGHRGDYRKRTNKTMKTFTIDNDTNNITAHPTAQEAESVAGAECFATAAALAGLASHWPAARLIEIWNGLPGATPVSKFKDRATAVLRIWKAIQNLEAIPEKATQRSEADPMAAAAPQTPGVAAEERPTKAGARRSIKPPVAATKKTFREGSKTVAIIELLKRPGGANLKEIMQATNWQAHSVRGFISGTLGKKMSLPVVSTKSPDGERTYSIQA
ncbi:MAG: DUF3489 domain-containing protein [Betaproteobacteria bacterium]